jgi:hypothetical protein
MSANGTSWKNDHGAQTVQLAAAAAFDSGQKMRIGVGPQSVSRADRAKCVTTFPVHDISQPVAALLAARGR